MVDLRQRVEWNGLSPRHWTLHSPWGMSAPMDMSLPSGVGRGDGSRGSQ